jgi:hypothetical protein
MRVFLDFEASSLSDDSYPVEVAWVFEDGRSQSFLIRPAPTWTDWDPMAQAIHGITREQLLAEGSPHEEVARRMVGDLDRQDLLASAPSWDGKWMSVLLRAAGLPRHALRLRDSEAAQAEAARQRLAGRLGPVALKSAVRDILVQVQAFKDGLPPEHRALPDAVRERQLWLEARRLADAWPLPSLEAQG